MKKNYFTGVLFIIIGIAIILYQNDWVDFSRADVVTYGCIAAGVLFLWRGFQRPDKHGILGGVFFTAFGVTMLLMREHILPRSDEFGFAAFFIILAVANYVFMFYKADKTTNLIWGSVFAIIGAFLYWAYLGQLPPWYIYDQIGQFWPLLLIFIGASLVIKGLTRRRHELQAHP